MQIQKAFGIALRQVREASDLTQEELALNADLDRTYISLLERGLRQPTLSSLFSLCDVLECKPSELVVKVEKLMAR